MRIPRTTKEQASDNPIPYVPMSRGNLCDMFIHLLRKDIPGCDHTLSQTLAFLHERGIAETPVLRWLQQHGGYWYCEVRLNVMQWFEEEIEEALKYQAYLSDRQDGAGETREVTSTSPQELKPDEEAIPLKAIQTGMSQPGGATDHSTPPTLPVGAEAENVFKPPQSFDFHKNWSLVLPHLPAANRVLEAAMHLFIVEQDLGNAEYDPSRGPWSYTQDAYWELSAWCKTDEAIQVGEFKWQPPTRDDAEQVTAMKWDEYFTFASRFYPKPDTVEWYQIRGAAHLLVPWQVFLARRIFSHLTWVPGHLGPYPHALGIDSEHALAMVFDILPSQHMHEDQVIPCPCPICEPRIKRQREVAERIRFGTQAPEEERSA